MKNQIVILATSILAIAPPTLAMNPVRQKELNKELFTIVKSNEVFEVLLVARLLDAGADPNAREEVDIEAVIREKLRAGITMTREEINQIPLTNTPLYYAALRGYEAVCKLLLERGANVHITHRFGATPLMYAAEHPAISKLFLEHGAQVNARDMCNRTALFSAAGTSAETCKLLLEHHADPTIKFTGVQGATPLIHAASHYRGPNQNSCTVIVSSQAQMNTAIKTTLLCLNRLKNTGEPAKIRTSAGILYHEFKTLLLPHIGLYIPLRQLLNMQDDRSKKAYDYLKIACLDPNNIDAIYTQSDITKCDWQTRQSWFSNCSIQ